MKRAKNKKLLQKMMNLYMLNKKPKKLWIKSQRFFPRNQTEDIGLDIDEDQDGDVDPDIVPVEEDEFLEEVDDYDEDEDEFLEEVDDYDEDEDEFLEEVDDYDEDEDEKELWDDDVPSDPGSDFFSAKITSFKLQKLLETIPEITDISTTIELLGALETIKTYRMPDRIKTNRVNFFATQL